MYPELLVVTSDPVLRECAASAASTVPFRVRVLASWQEALQLERGRGSSARTDASAQVFHVIDLACPNADQILREAGQSLPHVRRVFLQPESSTGRQSILLEPRPGCGDDRFVARPTDAVQMQRLFGLLAQQANSGDSFEVTGFDGLVGRSVAFRQAVDFAMRAANDADGPVLITGERGTGRRMFARAIHSESGRAERPWVEFDCRTLPAGFFESGFSPTLDRAMERTPAWNRLQQADGGTLILYDVTSLDRTSQTKLLSYVDAHKLWKVQQLCRPRLDLRIIATAERTIERDVRASEFSSELYDRLCAYRLNLPALRERPGDTLMLAEHFLTRFTTSPATPPVLTGRAKELLVSYPWPENLHELRRVMQRVCLGQTVDRRVDAEQLLPYLSTGRRLRATEMRPLAPISESKAPAGVADGAAGESAATMNATHPGGTNTAEVRIETGVQEEVSVRLPATGVPFESIERAVLIAALRQNRGNVVRTARFLRMGRGSLRYRLEKFQLVEPKRRAPQRGRPSEDEPLRKVS